MLHIIVKAKQDVHIKFIRGTCYSTQVKNWIWLLVRRENRGVSDFQEDFI
jgi:hypothetical protein